MLVSIRSASCCVLPTKVDDERQISARLTVSRAQLVTTTHILMDSDSRDINELANALLLFM